MLIFSSLGGKRTLKRNSLRNNLRSLFRKVLEGDSQTACVHKPRFLRKPSWRQKVSKQLASGKLLFFTSNISEEPKAAQFCFILRIINIYLTFNMLYSKWKPYIFFIYNFLVLGPSRYNFSWCLPSSSKRRKHIDRIDHALLVSINFK